MGFLIALAIIGGVAAVAGTAIATVGAVHETQGAAAQAELNAEAQTTQAEQLEELSGRGGYYDDVTRALKLQLEDIEADREAAAAELALTEVELEAALAQSELEQAAQVANLEGRIEVSELSEAQAVEGARLEATGAAIAGLETAAVGARAVGQIGARAGAGNVAGGSILRQAEAVSRQIGRRVSLSNLQGQFARAQGATAQALGTLERAELERNIGVVQGAAELEQLQLTNAADRARLQYEDVLRGLGVAEAQTVADETMTLFRKESGLEDAGLLRQQAGLLTSESEWLSTYGVGLAVAGGVVQGIGDVANILGGFQWSQGRQGRTAAGSGAYGGGAYTHAGPAYPGAGY